MTSNKFAHEEVLDNGLTLLIHEMPFASSVAALMILDAGPKYESDDILGAAHYLEHMIFEGSKNYPETRKLYDAIEQQGGQVSAYTDREEVVYSAKVPAENYEFLSEYLTEIVYNPLIKPPSVEKERGIITQELKRAIDDDGRQAWELLRKKIWTSNYLAKTTLGTFESIKNISVNDLSMFHDRYYRPDRTILAISGNVKKDDVIRSVGKTFGKLKMGIHSSKENNEWVFESIKPQLITEYRDINQLHLRVGFAMAGLGSLSPAITTAQVLINMLSREVFMDLIYKEGLAYSAGTSNYFFSGHGAIVLYAGLDPSKANKALKTLSNIIRTFEVSTQKLDEAKTRMKGGLSINMSDSLQFSDFIAYRKFLKKSVISLEERKKEIDRVNLDEVVDLKNKILQPNRMVISSVGPVEESDAQKFIEILI